MSNKLKDLSPLAQSVMTLDEYFAEMSRLGIRISDADMGSEADVEHLQRLMVRFAESAQGVSEGVLSLSAALNEARAKAEKIAEQVSARANELQEHQIERQKKMATFQLLSEKIQDLNGFIADLKLPESPTEEDKAKMSMGLSSVELRLLPLIEEAQSLKTEAQNAKMPDLEQTAHALSQKLLSLRKKIAPFQQGPLN